MNFIKRFKTNIKTAQKILDGAIIMCPYCKTFDVKCEEPQFQYSGDLREREYQAKCLNCNANSIIKESWSRI